MIKLVASDLDGTLLLTQGTDSARRDLFRFDQGS